MSMKVILVDTSFTCAAGTATPVFSRQNLAENYRRLDIAMQETGGANATTAATYEAGIGTAIKRDSTREAAIINASQLGTASGEYTLVLTDEDVPDTLAIGLTSAVGNTVAVKVVGYKR
jgi:tetrahydromethanopterin S-methyltransferase subunit D